MQNGNEFPPKHPGAVLDYQFDWAAKSNNTGLTDWLRDDEVILSHEIVAATGITVDSSTVINGGTTVLVWLSGGSNGAEYEITCKIETATRTDVRTAIVPVSNKK